MNMQPGSDIVFEEAERLNALHALDVLDTPAERVFDDIAKLAAQICEAPTALVSLVDRDRQWFKAACGLDATQTDLTRSVCYHAIRQQDTLVIADTRLDPRTSANPLNDEIALRFYAGVPLIGKAGRAYGTLCVLDTKVRGLEAQQLFGLETLARQVVTQLELRQTLEAETVLRQEIDHRVKNSLQQAAVVLRLQKRGSAPELADALDAALGRIDAIAAVHDALARLIVTDIVPADEFIENFLEGLAATLPDHVTVSATAAPVIIPTRHATNLAIFVNEFVANSVKHAFSPGAPGTVSFDLADEGATFAFTASDTGCGTVDAEPGGGLGTRIMDATAAALGATVTRPTTDRGTVVCLTIPRQEFEAPLSTWSR